MKLLGFIDDQPITTMPKICTVWPCKGKVRLIPKGENIETTTGGFLIGKGFVQCEKCGVSYGKP